MVQKFEVVPDWDTGQLTWVVESDAAGRFALTIGPSTTQDGYLYIKAELPDGTTYETEIQLA